MSPNTLLRWLQLLAFFVVFFSLGAYAQFAPGDTDTVVRTRDLPIDIYVYKPANYRGRGFIISLHGLTRNAASYRNHTRPLADRYGALLIVPYFDTERFPTWRYQHGGIARHADGGGLPTMLPAEQWTVEVLRGLVEYVRRVENAPEMPYLLIGHSAGGQFLSRVAAFSDLKPERIIIANPGTWVAPSLDEPFPYGFGRLQTQLGNARALERYLGSPVTVLVGTADTRTDNELSSAPGARRQGENRYARARNIFDQASAAARDRKVHFGWTIIEVPGVGHNARRMYSSAQATRAPCPDTVDRMRKPGATSDWPCEAAETPASVSTHVR